MAREQTLAWLTGAAWLQILGSQMIKKVFLYTTQGSSRAATDVDLGLKLFPPGKENACGIISIQIPSW